MTVEKKRSLLTEEEIENTNWVFLLEYLRLSHITCILYDLGFNTIKKLTKDQQQKLSSEIKFDIKYYRG